MRLFLIGFFITIGIHLGYAQEHSMTESISRSGSCYAYWGWNRGGFSRSDISFTGSDYSFVLNDVVATDRQTKFSFSTYFGPSKFTIPQYNFRFGYYLKENWDISIGIDHMKYVVQQNQTTTINGTIAIPNSIYNGLYHNDNIELKSDFLKFEHTDGLNNINIELRRSDNLWKNKKINLLLTEGFGIGILLPKTNTTLFGKDRYDEFHISGYGLSGVIGLKLLLWNKYFIQSEWKSGFINMPDIRTTSNDTDRASQHFFFYQYNIVFGLEF